MDTWRWCSSQNTSQNDNALAESAENFGIGFFKILYRIRNEYKDRCDTCPITYTKMKAPPPRGPMPL